MGLGFIYLFMLIVSIQLLIAWRDFWHKYSHAAPRLISIAGPPVQEA